MAVPRRSAGAVLAKRGVPVRISIWLLALSAVALPQANPGWYAGLKWRNIGPFRGGRVSAVSGVSSQPGVYYMGTPGGGIWKTVDGGTVWTPVFDQVSSVSSIGALAVAPSDPNVVYVGTGDVVSVGGSVNEGDGLYKSTDAGVTWHPDGLGQARHIVALLVDPHDPDVVLAAALGDRYSPSAARGIFRTSNGGRSWQETLDAGERIGAISLAWAGDNPSVVFAAMPAMSWRGGAAAQRGEDVPVLYRSDDEGATWSPVPGSGPPSGDELGRVGVAVAAHTRSRRVFAIVAGAGGLAAGGASSPAGLYRSDDGGATWFRATTDPRIVGSGYFSMVYVDTQDPDLVYVMQTSMYRSADGGRTFIAYKGAPGGEDQHVLWIDPANHDRMLLGSDQGATISLDGGRSWTSWFNQATGQLYRISTDNRFPYRIYATQQDNGALVTRSRGQLGQISSLDWWPVAGYEFGYIVPDPVHRQLIWVGGRAHGLERIDTTTGQWENVGPNIGPTTPAYRFATNPPLVFSPQDPHVLYEATQFVSMTRDQGSHWQNLSPDLTIPRRPADATAGAQAARGRGALDTVAPSALKAGLIWTGSTNGVAYITRDGGAHWTDITPAGAPAGGDFAMIEAGHFDAGTAYAALDNHLAGDFQPYIYRTHDFGKSWDLIVHGLPQNQPGGSFVRVVREDPVRRGLLFAGTESSAYVSFDDGADWQSLRLNLPTTSVRDLAIHGNDLVAGTYGRALWILDDITPLRQIASAPPASGDFLFPPESAVRLRRSVNRDMPNPPEIPHGPNPPDGAILDYYLAGPQASEVQLQVFDGDHHLVRSFTSTPPPASSLPPPAFPTFWLQQPQPLPRTAGEHRVSWDLRLAPPPALVHTYPNAAIVGNTPAEPEGPLVPPGHYQVRLTVDGKSHQQPLVVVNDPRVQTTPAALRAQFQFASGIADAMASAFAAHAQVVALRARLHDLAGPALPAELVRAAAAFDARLATLDSEPSARRAAGTPLGFAALNADLGSLLTIVEGADIPITHPQEQAFTSYCAALRASVRTARSLNVTMLPQLNLRLGQSQLSSLPPLSPALPPACRPQS